MKLTNRRTPGAICALWMISFVLPETASAQGAAPADVTELTMTVGTGVVIDCPDGISRLAASSPEIVDAVTASSKEVLFHAKGLGRATMVIWSRTNQRKTIT
jgi:Flp pilus assembly secretin CpaC